MSSSQDPTLAQEEFASLVRNTNRDRSPRCHLDDESDSDAAVHSDQDEEDRFRDAQIEAAMRIPTMDRAADLKLPPATFDSGRSTGVKGVIADARNYENARLSKWKGEARADARSVYGAEGRKTASRTSVEDSEEEHDEESFLQQWRESRLRELEREARSGVRNRRTSPSSKIYGRLDSVDALGYLDAIEKVGRDTVVVVFVYDHEVCYTETLQLIFLITGSSVWYHLPLSRHFALLFQVIRLYILSRSTTKISSSTTPVSLLFWRTSTRATSLPT